MSVAEPLAIPATHARKGTRIPWVLWLIALGMTGVGLALIAATNWAWPPGAYGFPGFSSLFALSYATVGAVVLSRRPDNLVGRVLLAAGLGAAFQTLYTEYAIVAIVTSPGSLPFGELAAWLVAWAWLPFVLLAGPLLLSIFPDGRLMAGRWRLAPVGAVVFGVAFLILAAFREGPLENFSLVVNPFGFIAPQVGDAVIGPISAGLAVGFVLPAASLVVRYRRSDSDRRHQLKWIAVAAVLLALTAPAGFSLGTAGQVTFIVLFCGIPIATGIAVLRYRLYEIDTIINRALVYGLLTAVIAGLYTASIGLMQRVSHALTGADSEATIVVTTIVIVAAFTPIKTRLQILVDKRFKEAVDPRLRLQAFTTTLQQRLWPLDRRLALQRFVDLVVSALALPGGEADFERDRTRLTARSGQPVPSDAVERWSTSASSGASRVTLMLATKKAVSERDAQAVSEALAALVRELDLA
jgi:hypothetical protein